MRSLDTNVLVRLLAADDRRQLAAVERLVDQSERQGETLFLCIPVLCELVWVLTRSYEQNRAQVVSVLEQLLEMGSLRIEQRDLVERALAAYRSGKGNFPDYLIGELSRHAGCRDTVTFDKALRGAPGFTILE
ncbi:MAG: type II toxin-antitoxin system VapC family toxin [Acidobacteriales bacterium]|nr:type II toxin-antitoxin system VapC family toxin [Terriglobales bacterium]